MVHFYSRVLFLLGFSFGILLFFVERKCLNSEQKIVKTLSYNQWFKSLGLTRKTVHWDVLRYNPNLTVTIEASFLFTKIKILCVILVRNEKNARASKSTWGNGCNNVEFLDIETSKNKLSPKKRVKGKSSWALLCQKLKTVTKEYDWVLIVNDDIFVIMENLRFYLAPLEATATYYLGHAVVFWSTVYNSAQAGYILSSGTVDAFKEKFTKTDCLEDMYWNREDFYLGRHLASLNITPVDTRDSAGFSTFHPHNLNQLFFTGDNHYKTSVFPSKCCSKKLISFQGIEGDKMYTYHYLLYTLQIFDEGNLGNTYSPHTIVDDQVWRTFLEGRNISADNVTSEQYYQIWENLIDDPTSFAANMKRENFEYD
ncbi:glycoprotein-N-acetylgalactosamine 3-beta-galactosyltransferase 1 [Leptinotarsa decemlineata]|uniref:glycoprotein-N-acetylgalactosamine 3-beta-galactosyltransferase 1 n=1 Tax=Leptinotarsa decemlineata TaxID=7539 RepID=UPI003D308E71